MSGEDVAVLQAQMSMVLDAQKEHRESIEQLRGLVWKLVGGVAGGSSVLSLSITAIAMMRK